LKSLIGLGVIALALTLSGCSAANETPTEQSAQTSNEISFEFAKDATIYCDSDDVYVTLRGTNKGSVAISDDSLQAAGVSISLHRENSPGKADSRSILTQAGGIPQGATGEIYAAFPNLFELSLSRDAVLDEIKISTSSGYKQTISIDLKSDVCN
jgi:hypothetical protein